VPRPGLRGAQRHKRNCPVSTRIGPRGSNADAAPTTDGRRRRCVEPTLTPSATHGLHPTQLTWPSHPFPSNWLTRQLAHVRSDADLPQNTNEVNQIILLGRAPCTRGPSLPYGDDRTGPPIVLRLNACPPFPTPFAVSGQLASICAAAAASRAHNPTPAIPASRPANRLALSPSRGLGLTRSTPHPRQCAPQRRGSRTQSSRRNGRVGGAASPLFRPRDGCGAGFPGGEGARPQNKKKPVLAVSDQRRGEGTSHFPSRAGAHCVRPRRASSRRR